MENLENYDFVFANMDYRIQFQGAQSRNIMF